MSVCVAVVSTLSAVAVCSLPPPQPTSRSANSAIRRRPRTRRDVTRPSRQTSRVTAAVSRLIAPRREILIAGGLAFAGAALLVALAPPTGDAPAHLYRTLLVEQGVYVWDNLWYGGHYPLASYSLLYYLPAALVGNLPLVFAAVVRVGGALRLDRGAGVGSGGPLAGARVRRARRRADLRGDVQLRTRARRRPWRAPAAAERPAVVRGRRRRTHARIQSARVRLPLHRPRRTRARPPRGPARGRLRGGTRRDRGGPARGARVLPEQRPVPVPRARARGGPDGERSRRRACPSCPPRRDPRRVLPGLGSGEHRDVRRLDPGRGEPDAASLRRLPGDADDRASSRASGRAGSRRWR